MLSSILDWFKNLNLSINPEYILAVLIGIVLVGIVLGFMKKIVVFRNYDDFGLVFLFGLVPLGGMLLMGFFEAELLVQIVFGLIVLIEIGILFLITWKTYQDNPNFLLFVIAMITKIPLAVLFLFNLIELINPSGKTGSDRSKSRRVALLWLTFLTPIIGVLVRDKEGVLTPRELLKGKRVGSLRQGM